MRKTVIRIGVTVESESNVLVSNQKQIRKANRLLLEMTETFSENNIVQAKSIYERILSSSTNDNATSTITAQKMLRLLAVLENYLVGAHRNNKADIHNVADVLYYNRFYFNDCYKDLIEELDEAIFYWYDKAALLGSASAYLKRARLLLYGRGVKQSMEEALDSYNKANEGSKDALEVWTSVKNDKVPTRADLADEVNVIKFYLFSEGLFNYEQNYEKAKEILSHLSNASLVKSLSALLTNKIENNKAKIIDKSILAKSQEYEDLKNDITEINEQIKEAERRKHEISSVLENAKSNMANAQDILNRMNEEIADKEKNIVTLAHRLQEMESEENTLSKSCSSKRNELTSLEGQIQELGQKYKKMADDCAALEMKYATFKEYEDVNQINSGKCEIDADNGNVETQYKQKLRLTTHT